MRFIKKVVKKTIYILSFIIDRLMKLLMRIFSKNTNKTLFIRMDIIGDNIVFLPFLDMYLKYYPNHFFVVNKKVQEIYNLLNIKDIRCFEERKYYYNLLYRIRINYLLLKYNYENAVNLVTHRSKISDLVLKLVFAKNKICYEGDYIQYKNKKINNEFCNRIIFYNSNNIKIPYLHIFLHEKNFFEQLTGEKIQQNIKEFYLSYYKEFKNNFKRYFSYDNYIVLITDASFKYRCYPKSQFQKVLDMLPKNIKIIQLGLNKFPLSHPNLEDLTGKTTLQEAMSIVMNASLVIGNETGLTHLAYLSGVPTVCILGGGHFGRFLPWKEFNDIVKCAYYKMGCFQCGWDCKYVDLSKDEVPPCISDISPNEIIKCVNELNTKYKFFKD